MEVGHNLHVEGSFYVNDNLANVIQDLTEVSTAGAFLEESIGRLEHILEREEDAKRFSRSSEGVTALFSNMVKAADRNIQGELVARIVAIIRHVAEFPDGWATFRKACFDEKLNNMKRLARVMYASKESKVRLNACTFFAIMSEDTDAAKKMTGDVLRNMMKLIHRNDHLEILLQVWTFIFQVCSRVDNLDSVLVSLFEFLIDSNDVVGATNQVIRTIDRMFPSEDPDKENEPSDQESVKEYSSLDTSSINRMVDLMASSIALCTRYIATKRTLKGRWMFWIVDSLLLIMEKCKTRHPFATCMGALLYLVRSTPQDPNAITILHDGDPIASVAKHVKFRSASQRLASVVRFGPVDINQMAPPNLRASSQPLQRLLRLIEGKKVDLDDDPSLSERLTIFEDAHDDDYPGLGSQIMLGVPRVSSNHRNSAQNLEQNETNQTASHRGNLAGINKKMFNKKRGVNVPRQANRRLSLVIATPVILPPNLGESVKFVHQLTHLRAIGVEIIESLFFQVWRDTYLHKHLAVHSSWVTLLNSMAITKVEEVQRLVPVSFAHLTARYEEDCEKKKF